MQNQINTYKYSQGSEFIKCTKGHDHKSLKRNLSPGSNGENFQFHDDCDEKVCNDTNSVMDNSIDLNYNRNPSASIGMQI